MTRRVVRINYSRNGQELFAGLVPVLNESSELASDLQRMVSYANQYGRNLTLRIEDEPPAPPYDELVQSLVKLLKHDGVINAETLDHNQLIAAVQDHIIVADTDRQREQEAASVPAKKKAAKKAPAKKAANKASKKTTKKQKDLL